MVTRKFIWKPYLMQTWPDAMLIKIFGMKYGLRRRKCCDQKKTQISHFCTRNNWNAVISNYKECVSLQVNQSMATR